MSKQTTQTRAVRLRAKLRRVSPEGRLRLSCHRSNEHIYAQIIDDTNGATLVSASTVDKLLRKTIQKPYSLTAAEQVGAELAKRAVAAGLKDVYFDRGGNRYQGRIKALADAARAGGLNF